MRRERVILCAFAGCFAFAVMLAFAAPPAFAGGAAAGMSAPAAPATSIEAAPAAKFLQPRFDWQGQVLRPAGLPFVAVAIRALDETRRYTSTAPPHYGPLHRRPPPSFS